MQQDIFVVAKTVDIDRFLTGVLGVNPVRANGWLRYSACPHCGESSKDSVKLSSRNGFWKCFGCDKSGDVIKAAAYHYGYGNDMLSAAKRLVDEFTAGTFETAAPRQSRQQCDEEDAKRHQAFARVLASLRGIDFGTELSPAIMAYLTGTRALPRDLVKQAYRKGLILGLPSDPNAIRHLLESRFSRSDLETSKLWKEGKKLPGIAYRPLVFPMPGGTAAEFRIIDDRNIKEGTLKAIRYGKTTKPWVWEGTDPTKPVLIVEGIIDMLSVVALGFKGDVIAVPGVNSWVEHAQDWFGHLIGKRVIVCFDNDPEKNGPIKNPGQHWSNKLIAALQELGVKEVENKVLPVGTDPNDVLKSRAAHKRQVA